MVDIGTTANAAILVLAPTVPRRLLLSSLFGSCRCQPSFFPCCTASLPTVALWKPVLALSHKPGLFPEAATWKANAVECLGSPGWGCAGVLK